MAIVLKKMVGQLEAGGYCWWGDNFFLASGHFVATIVGRETGVDSQLF